MADIKKLKVDGVDYAIKDAEAPYARRIPTTGVFTNTYSQSNMFKNCAGTRSGDGIDGAKGKSYTFYTQNQPIG